MEQINPQRIRWHSRRGMLELDLLLTPFAEQVFDSLPRDEQLLYEELIANEDQKLFAWLVSGSEKPDGKFLPLISKILAHSGSTD